VPLDIDDILNAVVTKVQALGLTFGGNPIPVEKGKQPRHAEGETANTQIFVHMAADPKRPRRFTSLHDLQTFRIRVAFWTPGNFDNTANLAALASIEDSLATALERKPADLLGLDDVRDVSSDSQFFVPKEPFLKGWDVIALDVEIEIVRERSAA
jgi:hypothetical protein